MNIGSIGQNLQNWSMHSWHKSQSTTVETREEQISEEEEEIHIEVEEVARQIQVRDVIAH